MSKDLNKISFGEVSTEVESRLGFKPDAAINNGLCVGSIINVELKEHDVPKQLEDGTPSAWEFAGMKTFSIDIEYIQTNVIAGDSSQRFLTQRETMVSATKATGEPLDVKVWNSLIMQQFARLQHIVNGLDAAKIAPLSKKISAIDLSYDDAPELRIQKLKKLYEYFVEAITGLNAKSKPEDKPRYEGLKFWMRVIAHPTRGSYFTLPDFVGKGYLEVVRKGVNASIELAPNDTITLTKKASKGKNLDAAAAGGDAGGASADQVLKDLGIA